MAKHLNINLAFNADTKQAKAQINDLIKTLDQAMDHSIKLNVTGDAAKEIQKSVQAAGELQAMLNNATNVDTGRLDLSKFSKQLTQNKVKLADYASTLINLGDQGEQAFLKLANAVVSAEVPLRRSSKMVDEFATTLKNTARWQFSSSMLHGFMGAMSSAYGYAQDLNESLNNIRIVSGQSAEEMAEFARQANKAAKALNTTTTSYTNAALIYYQQGLASEEIEKRTEITIKMANVARQSAEVVSDQLTAVWNNFYKGGEEGLEHYADVMTALGAATASSTDEIAGGLEKFASIADMIGLSFDYAASALATITATTRQSEEVVGTALKTIFARIQGLKVGETLEDGTDLNKYSDSLRKVGIDIFDTTGQLKDMDVILDEMGNKWDTLSKSQQVALAQAVAGIRQYNQLVSLMDNYDYFKENLGIAQTSEGALDEQAEIFAESWEAARKRVQASLEGLYQDILDDDFFIAMANNFATIIEGIDKLTDSMGGLAGVLGLVGTVATTVFEKQMATGIDNAIYNFSVFTGAAQHAADITREEMIDALKLFNKDMDPNSAEGLQGKFLEDQITLTQQLEKATELLNDEEIRRFQNLIEIQKKYGEVVIEAKRAAEAASEALAQTNRDIRLNLFDQALEGKIVKKVAVKDDKGNNVEDENGNIVYESKTLTTSETVADWDEMRNTMMDTAKESQKAENLMADITNELNEGTKKQTKKYIEKIKESGIELDQFDEVKNAIQNYDKVQENKDDIEYAKKNQDALNKVRVALKNVQKGMRDTSAEYEKGKRIFKSVNEVIEETAENLKEQNSHMPIATKKLVEMGQQTANVVKETHAGINANDQYGETYDELAGKLENAEKVLDTFGTNVVRAFQGISQITLGIQSLSSAFEVLNNDNMSFGEKFSSVILSLSMGLPMLIEGFSDLSRVINAIAVAEKSQLLPAIMAHIVGINLEKTAQDMNTKATLNQVFAKGLLEKSEKSLLARLLLTAGGYKVQEGATEATTLATFKLNTAMLKLMGVIGLVVAVAYTLVKVFEAIYEASPEAKLERLQDSAERASSAFEKVKNSVDNARQALIELESTQDTIKGLTKYTNEWYEAIANSNAKLREIIELYPELKDYVITDENGIMDLDSEGKIEFENLNNKRLYQAEAISLNAERNLKEEELNQSYDQDYKFISKYNTNNIEEETFVKANSDQAKILQQLYEEKGLELLSEKEGKEAREKAIEELRTQYPSDIVFKTLDEQELLRTLQTNQKIFENNTGNRNYLDQIIESQSRTRFLQVGSNREANQVDEIFQDENLLSNVNTNLKDLKDKGFQNEVDYKPGDYIYDNGIARLLELYGGNAEYIGQEDKEMVFSINGDELRLTADDFYSYMEELFTLDNFSDAFGNTIKEDLSEIFGNKEIFDGFNTNSLIAIDNLRNGFSNTLALEYDQNKFRNTTEYSQVLKESGKLTPTQADELFSKIINQEEYGLNEQGLEKFQNDTAYIDYESEDFKNIALNYQITGNVEETTQALQELNAENQLLAMSSFFNEEGEAMGLSDEEISDMQDYAEHLRSVSKESDILDENLIEDAETSAELAVQVTKMNKGVEQLAEGFEDWGSVLKKSSKESAEYSKAMSSTRKALSNVLDVEEEFISNDFVEEHLEEIGRAAKGDAEAIDALHMALADDIILNIVGVDNFDELSQPLKDNIQKLKDLIALNPLEIGAKIDIDTMKGSEQEFINACNEIIKSANMTSEQANAYFGQMGFEAKFVEEEKTITSKKPVTKTVTQNDTEVVKYEDGSVLALPATRTWSYIDGYTEVDETVMVPAMTTGADGKTEVPQIESITKKAPGSMNNYSSSNSGGKSLGKGGGGSKGSKPKKVNKSDIVERYKEINDQLDDMSDAISDTSKESDRLFGAKRLASMKKENDLLKQQTKLLEQKKQEIIENLEIDKQALKLAAQEAGINFNIDDELNTILNYTEQMTILYNRMDDLVKKAGEAVDEKEQEVIDELQEKIDNLEKAISLFDQTRELLQEQENLIVDNLNQIQDNNYEQLTYHLELKIDINDADLKRLEYFIDKFSDNFYKMAEIAGYMKDSIEPTEQNLTDQMAFKGRLDNAFAAGEISHADYIEGLKNVRDAIYEQLEALNQLDKDMLHYYEDTLAAGTEELADHTDHLEHLTSVFDHYISLMGVLGKSYDLGPIGEFLGGRADTLRDRLDVAKSYLEVLEREKAEAEMNYLSANDEASKEFFKEELDAIIDEYDSAQEQVLSLTEEWAQAMKEVVENNMNKLAETLEDALTKGFGFDRLMDNFEKLNTRQEEYLTKTNQIYETNKLMRTANKALDETDNQVAKQKFKNFIEETKALQNNTKLSQYELEIQQAKYELLLAEIALEEAQNAKSTVRMSRDNDGNFGYVFTADDNEIDDAQQGVDDASNRLYNLYLEGQQEYTEKYLQAQQEMYESLADLQQQYLNGEIGTEEEYKARLNEIYAHYYGPDGVLATYAKLAGIAIEEKATETGRVQIEASNAVKDNWQKDYLEMTESTEQWDIAVKDYLQDIERETEVWSQVSLEANRDVNNALKDNIQATEKLTQESEIFSDVIIGSVVPAIEEEYKAVGELTEQYANQRAEIQALIAEYEAYLALLDAQIAEESRGEAPSAGNSDSDFMFDAIYSAASGDKDGAQTNLKNRWDKINNKNYDTSIDQSKINKVNSMSEKEKEQLLKELDKAKEYGYTSSSINKLLGYATGGYTGEWGSEGRLALLHQKELVLNEEDTSNVLQTVSLVRDLVSAIDTNAQMASIMTLNASVSKIQPQTQNLEQKIQIDASFPAASDRFEIEAAFNSLVNQAAQYANRR